MSVQNKLLFISVFFIACAETDPFSITPNPALKKSIQELQLFVTTNKLENVKMSELPNSSANDSNEVSADIKAQARTKVDDVFDKTNWEDKFKVICIGQGLGAKAQGGNCPNAAQECLENIKASIGGGWDTIGAKIKAQLGTCPQLDLKRFGDCAEFQFSVLELAGKYLSCSLNPTDETAMAALETKAAAELGYSVAEIYQKVGACDQYIEKNCNFDMPNVDEQQVNED